MTTLTPYGSIKTLMNELVALEETVHDDLTVYRWRPLMPPQIPALYNWMIPAIFEVQDTARWRDTIAIQVNIATHWGDEMGDDLEDYADAFRDTVDDSLWKAHPLNNAAYRARRRTMQTVEDVFNDTSFLAIRFDLEFDLDRKISAT